MTKTTIIWDHDDVLYPLNEVDRLVNVFNEALGTSVAYEEIHDFDLTKVFGIDRERMKELIQEVWARETEEDFQLRERDMYQLLKRTQDYNNVTITARPNDALDMARRVTARDLSHWLGVHHFPRKGPGCKELGGVVLIDDTPHNLECAEQHGVYPILYNQPWNKNQEDRFVRVYSIEHALDVVDSIKGDL